MKAVIILFTGLLLTTQTALANEPDPANGQNLFVNSKCDTEALTGNPNIVSLEQLDREVRTCDINQNINWYDFEVKDVVAYLNQTYYNF